MLHSYLELPSVGTEDDLRDAWLRRGRLASRRYRPVLVEEESRLL